MNKINNKLLSVSSFEKFEELKLNNNIFEDFVNKILLRHQLKLFSEGTNIVFSYDDSLVIKLFPPFHQDQFQSERLVLKALERKLSIITPTLHFAGEIMGWPYIIMSQLKGTLLETIWHTLSHDNKLVIIKDKGKLPLIFPIVVYAGKAKYTAPRNLWALFEYPELAKKLMTEDYALLDLQAMSDEDIAKKKHIACKL